MDLRSVSQVKGKEKVLLRLDLDVADDEIRSGSSYRIDKEIKTLVYLIEQGCKVVVMGHRGRSDGENDSLSMLPVSELLGKKLKESGIDLEKIDLMVMENLRFDKGETENSLEFAKKLAKHGNIFVNESFAVSHRKHASVYSLHRILPTYFGFRFLDEVKRLEKFIDGSFKKPILIMGGKKKSKIDNLNDLRTKFWKVVITGRLPEHLGDVDRDPQTLEMKDDEQIVLTRLNPDKEDITLQSIEVTEKLISKSDAVVFAGPPGKFEEEGQELGTERILKAISLLKGFKMAGGGDTERALKIFGMEGVFDWVSVGGGAMLYFLAKGKLPAFAF